MKYQDYKQPELIKGIKFWQNPKNKMNVLALHYSADPDKDPDRNGKEWYNKERSITPKAKWDKEYEGDFASRSGKLVFGKEFCDFDPAVHLIESKPVEGEYVLACDFGQSNPTAMLVGIIDSSGVLYIVDEYYNPAIPSVSAREATMKFKDLFGLSEDEILSQSMDERRDMYYNKFQLRVIDPSTRSKNRSKMKDGVEIPYSVLEEFYDNGIDFELGNNDVQAGINKIRELFKIQNGQSGLYIFKDKCPKLSWEIQRYKYKEQTEAQERANNATDKIQKKNDHAVDALKYLVLARPTEPTIKPEKLTKIQQDILNKVRPQVEINYWDID